MSADPETVALVRAAQRGDTLAMDELMDRLAPYVGRICAPIALRDGADAAQEALIAVFRSLRVLRRPEALYGWVRRVAVREALRVARRNARAVPGELDEPAAPGDPELATDIADVLARLPPDHRAILMLRDREGLDERSAAAVLGITVGTAKSRLHRARQRFQEAWNS